MSQRSLSRRPVALYIAAAAQKRGRIQSLEGLIGTLSIPLGGWAGKVRSTEAWAHSVLGYQFGATVPSKFDSYYRARSL